MLVFLVLWGSTEAASIFIQYSRNFCQIVKLPGMSGIALKPDPLTFLLFPVWSPFRISSKYVKICQNKVKIFFSKCLWPEHESCFIFFAGWITSGLAPISFCFCFSKNWSKINTKLIYQFESAWPPEPESDVHFCVWQTTSGLGAILFFLFKTGPNLPKDMYYRTYDDIIYYFRFRDLFRFIEDQCLKC